MVTKSSNVYYLYDQSDPRVAQRVRSKRQDERNNSTSHGSGVKGAETWGVRKVRRASHRQGGGVEGCSSGVVCENRIVGSKFSEGMWTHTLFEYPLGKPLEAQSFYRN